MPFLGKQLQPVEIVELLYDVGGFRDFDLVEMTATVLGESQGFVLAYNDNVVDGKVKSRDIGLGQINIQARDIGTKKERDLYDPVKNVKAIRRLFDTRETLTKRRRFNPWYAYTKGWATFPEWWVFRSKEAAKAQQKPREWVPTGKYIHQAIIGVANFYARRFGIKPSPFVTLPDPPPKPLRRPLDGDGPRPKENKGRGHGR